MRHLPLFLLFACTPPGPAMSTCLDANDDDVCDGSLVDWSADARIGAGTDRHDLYQLGDALLDASDEGMAMATAWPVDVSGVLLPYEPLHTFFDTPTDDEGIIALRNVVASQFGFDSMASIYDWLGATPFNEPEAMGAYRTPRPVGFSDGDRMGVTRLPTAHGEALTFSCAACHTESLFGRTIVGLSNRQPRANEFFHLGTRLLPDLEDDVFVDVTGATEGDMWLLDRARDRVRAVGIKVPESLGLDTSLAQVALSLARRQDDEYATRHPDFERSPRENALETFVADSKPMPWWTLKYKTRWLADGSIVSGNPILTNFLWNELGRGTDLDELEAWMTANPRAIDTLTVAVFATVPPRYTDFFDPEDVDLEAAKRGQVLFTATCAECHGDYDKAWDVADASPSPTEILATTQVHYHQQTPVFDVGTDPNRHQGMRHFSDTINDLAISQAMGTFVEPQQGYVPPPLDGIWARYPYLHNNSVPTLCDMLVPAAMRTVAFHQGPSDDPDTDFDPMCVGYPTGDSTPQSWRDDEDTLFETSREGMSNQGHDDWLTDSDGELTFDEDQRSDLVMFLKTL